MSFPIEPGSHRVIVRVPGCREMETNVDVKDGADLDLRGALESDEGKLVRGASGTPNGLRLRLGAWFPTTRFSDGYGIKPEIAAEAQPTYPKAWIPESDMNRLVRTIRSVRSLAPTA